MTTGTVTARFLAEDGSTPLSGFVSFRATAKTASGRGADNASAVLSLQDGRATLDAQGRISIVLQATDDPFLSPIGWQWIASPMLDDGETPVYLDEFAFELPGAATVDLASVVPAAVVSPGVIITRGVPGPMGPASVAVADTTPAEPGTKLWIETNAGGDPDGIRLYFEDGT